MTRPTETIGGATAMVRPGGDQLRLLEQTIHDPLLSITFQIHKADSRHAKYAYFIRLLGAIPLGQRTFYFDHHGQLINSMTDNNMGRIETALEGWGKEGERPR